MKKFLHLGCGLMMKSGLTAIHPWKPERVFHGDVWDFSQAETMSYKISLNLEGRKKELK